MFLNKGLIMISNKILYQRGFNDLFFKFMDDIIQMFSNEPDFIIAKTTFETLKRANPSSLVKAWYKFITTPFIAEYGEFLSSETSLSNNLPLQATENWSSSEQSIEKMNVLLFLKSYETNINKNTIPELNGFFIKLKSELDNIISSSLRSGNTFFSPSLDTENSVSSTLNSDEKMNKLIVINNYFNKLNKLCISYST